MRRPSPALVIACLALFVALGGPAAAARLIGSEDVRDGSLQAKDLSKRAQRALKRTPPSSVTDRALADSAVTTRSLAPGAVLSGSVGDESLTNADLAANSVTAEEVAEGAVGQAEIRNNGVGASEIADQSIDTGEVIDGALLARDIARFSGILEARFGSIPARACKPAPVSGAAPADADISRDLIVVSAGSDWPTNVLYDVRASTELGRFWLYACNPTDGSITLPEVVLFRYAIIASG